MEAAIALFFGAVLGALASIGTTWIIQRSQVKISGAEQIQTRRTQRHEYLIRLMNDLILATYSVEAIYGRFDTEEELAADKEAKENYASAMGRAAAVCLASGNPDLKTLKTRMTPYLVEDHRNTNRDCLHQASEILAELINQLTTDDTIAAPKPFA
jgi:hypothetical protein